LFEDYLGDLAAILWSSDEDFKPPIAGVVGLGFPGIQRSFASFDSFSTVDAMQVEACLGLFQYLVCACLGQIGVGPLLLLCSNAVRTTM
jgi:hypothetical protein